MSSTVDTDRVARWAGRVAAPGPKVERAELLRLVSGLHAAAEQAFPVARAAGAFGDALPADVARPAVLVVDRPGWARVAAGSLSALMAGPEEGDEPGRGSGLRGWPATAQIAGLISVLSTRVLGQFDPYGSDDEGGRLALVAPNILQIGTAMGAEPADFRLWICVHEQTHALQFAAAPWLAGHIAGELAALQSDLDEANELVALRDAVLARRRRGAAPAPDLGLGPLGSLLPAEQQLRAAHLVATMSLLEGHADVTMDEIPPGLVPSRRRLREKMSARRLTGQGTLLRRVLGIDAKLDQYRRGADFVRTVRRAGPHALDPVWTDPSALPSPEEIEAPEQWLARTRSP